MNGKSKCKILKDIRKKIAEENDITYVTSECKYQGDCSGTCPKCEAELRYLEQELAKRQTMGKAVAVAGIAAALVVGSSGCAFPVPDQTAGAPPYQDSTCATQPYGEELDDEVVVVGEIAVPEDTMPLMGRVELPEESTCQE